MCENITQLKIGDLLLVRGSLQKRLSDFLPSLPFNELDKSPSELSVKIEYSEVIDDPNYEHSHWSNCINTHLKEYTLPYSLKVATEDINSFKGLLKNCPCQTPFFLKQEFLFCKCIGYSFTPSEDYKSLYTIEFLRIFYESIIIDTSRVEPFQFTIKELSENPKIISLHNSIPDDFAYSIFKLYLGYSEIGFLYVKMFFFQT